VIEGADRDRLRNFGKEFKVTHTVLADPDRTVKTLYALRSNPSLFIVDKKGMVRYVAGYNVWTKLEEEIETIMASADGKLPEPDLSTVDTAIAALKDENSYVRWKAAKSLGEMADNAAVSSLMEALKDEHQSVRWHAAQALGTIADESSVGALTEALQDEVGNVREFAAQALGNIGDESAANPLIDALKDESAFVKRESIKALGSLQSERAIRPLVKFLQEDDFREDTAKALAEIDQPFEVEKALGSEIADMQAKLGHAYMERDSFYDAIIAYNYAMMMESSNYRKRSYMKELAVCYLKTNQDEPPIYEYAELMRYAKSTGMNSGWYSSDGDFGISTEREDTHKNFLDVYEKQDKLKQAERILQEKITSSPEDAVLYEMLSGVYDKLELSEKSVEMYKKSVELDPDNFNSYFQLISVSGQAEDFETAITTAKEVAQKLPKDTENYGKLGKVCQEAKLYDEAADAYKKAIELFKGGFVPKDSYQRALGKCYEGAKKYDLALETYQNFIKKGQLSAKRDIDRLYQSSGPPDEAIEKFKAMLNSNPNDGRAREGLAAAYQAKGMHDEAIAEYKKLVEEKPDDAGSHSLLASGYERAKAYDEAIAEYNKAISLATVEKQKRQQHHRALVSCLEKAGKGEHVMTELNKMIESSAPERAWAVKELWNLHDGKKTYDEAVRELSKVAEAYPNDALVHELLGDAHKQLGKDAKAKKEHEKWFDLREQEVKKLPSDVLAGELKNVARNCLRKEIRLERAQKMAEEAEKLRPDDRELVSLLSQLYVKNGLYEKALDKLADNLSLLEDAIERIPTLAAILEIARTDVDEKTFSNFCKKIENAEKPTVKLGSHVALAEFYKHHGEGEKAKSEWAKTAFANEEAFLLVGPFDNTDNVGFEKEYPPEQDIDMNKTYQGKGDKDVKWEKLSDKYADGFVNLEEIFEDNRYTVAYGLTTVISPAEREAQLRIGSDDDVKVWLNGEPVWKYKHRWGPATIDRDIVNVKLNKGKNSIMVKVTQGPGGWGFYLRITDTNGKPFDDVKFAAY